MNKDKTIHIISQAHLDLAWLWSWQKSYSEAINNVRTVVRLMETYPSLTFTYSNAVIYQWMKDSAPGLFCKIQKLVKEGRWELIGGWLVEADCNLPSGESFIRQALYGKNFFQHNFEQKVNTGYCPDAFGHCGGLPQILKQTGYEYYVFSKPRLDDSFPHLFQWESTDGSRIPTWRIYGAYATGPDSTPETLEKEIYYAAENNFPPNCNHTALMLGLGDHGGGPSEAQIKAILDLAKREDLPNIKFSTFRELFANLRNDISFDDLPVIKGEIQPHNIGCYSANGKIKHLNRKTEIELSMAETVETVARLNYEIPTQHSKLKEAWESLLFNQFHDILAGTCIEQCYDDAAESIGSAIQTAKKITTSRLHMISGSVDTSKFKYNGLFAFNPIPAARHEYISLDMFTAIDGCEGPVIKSVIDPETKKHLPVQWVNADAPYGPWLREWKKLLVPVELPPCGYKVFELSADEPDDTNIPTPLVQWGKSTDKLGIKNIIDNCGNPCFEDDISLIVCDDYSDTFGHNRTSFLGEKKYLSPEKEYILEQGPLRYHNRLTGIFNRSNINMQILTYPEKNYIDIEISGNWQEHNSILKLELPTALSDSKAFFQMPFECIERTADGSEVPGHSWCALSGKLNGKNYNIGIINSGIYSFDAVDNTMHLTLRRSVQAPHYNELQYSEEQGKKFLDQGEFTENLRIIMWEEAWDSTFISKVANEFQLKSYVLMDTIHDGTKDLLESFLHLDAQTTVISSLKTAESGNAVIIRLVETGGCYDTANIISKSSDFNFQLKLNPYQVRTVRLNPYGNDWEIEFINALEKGK
jgi:alpha-mannosidase